MRLEKERKGLAASGRIGKRKRMPELTNRRRIVFRHDNATPMFEHSSKIVGTWVRSDGVFLI